ncbi:hypothetical protein DEU56DRAFT_813819 [Suillus clintonianus]|uniref:uncharacterized protein n=1 Tax=Suillus clintonianus TaxID=1904413 RepID=UPI001B86BE67|nr:uncharacterized protein DEU56DRAFT_813819 [Suillus clintonianus]KAG2131676.1 hypothetical protein DEU56DRAFT_813819 [Suillus clintonianus]
MLSTRLIRRLLKRLCQILAALVVSSAQRLRILVTCFRHLMTKIRSFPRHNTDSTSFPPDSCTVLTNDSSVRCPRASLPLPLHNRQITSASAASGMPAPSFPSPHPYMHPTPPQASTPTPTGSASSSSAPDTIPEFKPFVANEISRYENRPLVTVDKDPKRDSIPALMRQFPNESCLWLSGDWQSCVHPEGVLYLYNHRRGAFTETKIDGINMDGEKMDGQMLRLIDKCVDELYDLARRESLNLEADANIELVVQLAQTETEGGPQVACHYYFVDHAARIVFWLHDRHQIEGKDDIFSGIRGVADPSHIRYALESEYWTHCEYYPIHQINRPQIIKELRELVMHTSAEVITSDISLSPFDADELSRIMELINHLKENDLDNDPHSTCVIARFMHYFYRAKFFNFCGLPCARLEADKSVYGEDTDFHPLTRSISFALNAMLFWAPQAHLEELQKVWVDECTNMPRWKDFNKNLMMEWTGITIYSTVMLAVDVSFLAVPNVNISQSQSIGIIATYLSIIFITGSLIVSVLLVRQNQRYGFESADKAAIFLSNMTGTFFGVRALATVHSLPYAMLMWGMIFFAVAILYNVFKSTTVAMLASVASGCVVVIMFIFWFIWAAREIHLSERLAKSIFPSVLARNIS